MIFDNISFYKDKPNSFGDVEFCALLELSSCLWIPERNFKDEVFEAMCKDKLTLEIKNNSTAELLEIPALDFHTMPTMKDIMIDALRVHRHQILLRPNLSGFDTNKIKVIDHLIDTVAKVK